MNSAFEMLQQIAALTGKKPGGKQRIGMLGIENAVSGQKLFMPSEEFAAYLRSGAAYMESLRPVGHVEEQLAQKIVDANWWLNRSYALENNLLNARRLENSAQSDRSTDDRTDSMLAQALGYSDECGGSDAFAVLSRCATRVSQLYAEAARQLTLAQSDRIASGGHHFVLAESRAYAWYMEQIPKAERMAANDSAPGATLVSRSAINAAVSNVLPPAEASNIADEEDAKTLKRFGAG